MTDGVKISFGGVTIDESNCRDFTRTTDGVGKLECDLVYDPYGDANGLPALPSARTDESVMFTLSREVLRMPINEGDSLTYGDVFYANRFVRECGDDPAVFEKLIRGEHESAANLLAWCRNDVSVAIAVCQSVARLRLAIVMSDNS